MGYQILGTSDEGWFAEVVSDEAWGELLGVVGEADKSLPHSLVLGEDEEIVLDGGTRDGLHATLVDALGGVLAKMPPSLNQDYKQLDRDTVHRVRYVLEHDEVRLRRTPAKKRATYQTSVDRLTWWRLRDISPVPYNYGTSDGTA